MRRPRTAGGQALVLFALASVVMIGMVGLVIDGGALLAQQRVAQNGADGAATAGTVEVAAKLGGTAKTNADVWAAIDGSATSNLLQGWTAEYTDDFGRPIGQPVTNDGAPVPAGALGVHVRGSRPSQTTFSRVMGITQLGASADATVVAGALDLSCVADEDGCVLLPITFPVSVYSCDDQGNADATTFEFPPPEGGVPFETGYIWPTVNDPALMNDANMAILPLCKLDPGSVGWLDLDPTPGTNLQEEISQPPNRTYDLPDYFQTTTGNPNSAEDEINDYAGGPILLPMFTETCRIDPGEDPCPPDQQGVGDPTGTNTWYHVQAITTFWLDQAYVQGGNVEECTHGPGQPVQDMHGAGFVGCLKGWFVKYQYSGPIVPGGIDEDYEGPIGIQLIR